MKKITLVGCCREKLSGIAQARNLYRSQLFQKSALWADRKADPWFVLSAKYGLIKPDNSLAAYDVSMRDLTQDERRDWALSVVRQLENVALFMGVERFSITLLAGKDYAAFAPLVHDWCVVEQPMEGMQIGQRLQWLTEQNMVDA